MQNNGQMIQSHLSSSYTTSLPNHVNKSMIDSSKMTRIISVMLIFICFVFFFCEYLIYFVVQFPCDWPTLPQKNQNLRVLMIADTHLLGPYRGHWFDKLRREWQMATAFMVANTLHSPDVIFFLGDIFDEGKWANQKQYEEYVERFMQMFPASCPHQVLVGNHDVGFHYMMDHIKLKRFYQTFNLSSSDVLRLGGITFVTVNSMALEGDGCNICKEAEERITKIASSLKPDDKPILLQHFPLYRKSDELCPTNEDSAPDEEKRVRFQPKQDCLSESSSTWLLQQVKPRAIFSGHTHHSCVYEHMGVSEYSVPSFSWRNRNNPSYFLVTFSPDKYAVHKCHIPQESFVIHIYIISLFSLIAAVCLFQIYQRCRARHIKML